MNGTSTNFHVVARRLRELPAGLRPVLVRAMRAGMEQIRSLAQKEYLTGPRPQRLGVVSGALRSRLAVEVKDDGQEIVGRIGSNLPYARRHEFGHRGIEQVKAHTRVVGITTPKGFALSQEKKLALRGAIREEGGKLVGFKRGLKTVARGLKGGSANVVFVKAHTRTANTPARPFLRPAIARCVPQLVRDIHQALARALASS
jgi:phage gpG-like protein